MTENDRYKIFRKWGGRCHHCGTRLQWEFHDVRGRSGGWLAGPDDKKGEVALCFRCHELPVRKGSALRIVESDSARS